MDTMIVQARAAVAALSPASFLACRVTHLPFALLRAVILGGALALFATRGILYPLFTAGARTAWGGPTMAGAWAVHFILLAAIVAVLALGNARLAEAAKKR